VNQSISVAEIGENKSLKVLAYNSLKASILNMNIYDADADLRLDERDLSAKLGISRTPLREALAQLDQEGLIKVVARRGIFIVRKSKKQILEAITVWAALESMAARLACAVAKDEELKGLYSLVEEFSHDELALRMGEYSDANIAFHERILSLSKCQLLHDMAGDLVRHVKAIRNRTIMEQDRARRSLDDHRRIVDALNRRDAELAERLVREHTLKLREHVARHVDID